MKVVLTGHLVLDEIHTLDGGIFESLGGMAFPLYAFASIAKDEDAIVPVFPVGQDAAAVFDEAFAGFPAVSLECVYGVERENTRVRLHHESLAHYNTRLVASLDSIPFDRINASLDGAGLVYINMMTGDDVALETLDRIRESSSAMIFLDLHMIAYAVEHDGLRHLESVRNWKDWVRSVDILQCNELECATFVPEGQSERQRAELLFGNSNIRIVIVTKGEQGSTLYTRTGEPRHVPARKAAAIVDPTGCGDVFGAVFGYIYARTLDEVCAAEAAAHAAAFVAGIPGSLGIHGLRMQLDSME